MATWPLPLDPAPPFPQTLDAAPDCEGRGLEWEELEAGPPGAVSASPAPFPRPFVTTPTRDHAPSRLATPPPQEAAAHFLQRFGHSMVPGPGPSLWVFGGLSLQRGLLGSLYR